MRPIRKGSQWENPKASVEASVRASVNGGAIMYLMGGSIAGLLHPGGLLSACP